MTSDEFADVSVDIATYANYDKDPGDPALHRLVAMIRTRVDGNGRDQYEVASDVQSVEVKPMRDLLQDIREEAADLVPYAAAIHVRVEDDEVRNEVAGIAIMAYDLMAACERIERALDVEGVTA